MDKSNRIDVFRGKPHLIVNSKLIVVFLDKSTLMFALKAHPKPMDILRDKPTLINVPRIKPNPMDVPRVTSKHVGAFEFKLEPICTFLGVNLGSRAPIEPPPLDAHRIGSILSYASQFFSTHSLYSFHPYRLFSFSTL